MTEEKILKKIGKLYDDESFEDVVKLIEGLEENERTPRIICELGKAYNNLAVYSNPDCYDTDMLERAVSLLKSIEDKLPEKDHLLNFRLGYALFYLDRDGEALDRFKIALETVPEDEDTKYFIDQCRNRVAFPLFDNPFSQRIKEGWNSFSDGEEKLRGLISEKADSEEITDLCHSLLSPVFTDFCFEVGFNGEKYDLILSPEKDKLMLYLYDTFKKQAPDNVKEHWNILLGRQSADDRYNELGFMGKRIAPSEVTVKIEQEEGASYCGVIGYSDQLSALLRENRGSALWFFDLLLDMTIGEVVNMRYIDTIDLTEKPFEESEAFVPLPKLPEIMKERFGDNEGWDSAESYLESGFGYQRDPREVDEDGYFDPRSDIFAGFNCLTPLVGGYYNFYYDMFNKAYNNGAAAGFIFYPVNDFEGDEQQSRGEKILNFREGLQQYIEDNAGDACAFIGGASGIYDVYLDFIAWDLKVVLDASKEFLEQNDIVPWAYYQSFRSDVPSVMIKNNC